MLIAIQSRSSRFPLAPDWFGTIGQQEAYAPGSTRDNAPCYYAAIIRRARTGSNMIAIED